MIKNLISFFLLTVTLLVSCQSDSITEEYTGAEKAKTENIAFKTVHDVKAILGDDEPLDTLYLRSFSVKRLLNIQPQGNDSFRLLNYSPTTIKDITIYAKLKNSSERIKVYTLDSITSFTELKFKTPFINTDAPTYYSTESGKWIEISGLQSNGDVVYSLDSPDPIFVKLKNLKIDWTVSLNIRKGGNWDEMMPWFAREYVVFFSNMAYMFDQEGFKPRFDAYDGLIDNDGAPITQETKDKIYNKIINMKTFTTGIVNYGGLGGGDTLGISESDLLWQYNPNWGEIAFHELGHCLGYGHESNMTYSSGGKAFYMVCGDYWTELLRSKQMPFWDYKLLNTEAKHVPGSSIPYEKY